MEEKMRIGQVGVGGMGRAHVLAVEQRDDCEFVAACDIADAALKPFAEKGVPTFTSAEAMFDQVPMDAVILVLPHDLYPHAVAAAMDRGIHVLKEKPLARGLKDALTMLEKSRQTGCRLFVFGQRKSDPYYLKMKSLVEEELLGTIHMVHAAIFYYWSPASQGKFGWRGVRDRSGGIAIIDSGFHILDVVQQLMGIPVSVFAETGESLHAFPDIDYSVDDRAAILLKYRNGAFANVLTSYAVQPAQSFIEAYGTQGSLHWREGSLTHHTVAGESATYTIESDGKTTIDRQLKTCLDAIRSGKESLLDVENAIDVQRTIEAAYQSSREGRLVSL